MGGSMRRNLIERLLALYIVFFVVTLASCSSKKAYDNRLELSIYLDQPQEDVLKDLINKNVDIDEKSNTEQGFIILHETIVGFEFITIMNFGRIPGEAQPITCNIIRQAKIDLKQDKIRIKLNELYSMMKGIYGEPIESKSNIIELSGVTFSLDELKDESVRRLLVEGRPFDSREVAALKMNWITTNGVITSLSISGETGLTIYEQSAKAAEVMGANNMAKSDICPDSSNRVISWHNNIKP